MRDPLLRALNTVWHFTFTILCGLGTTIICTLVGGLVMGKGTCPLGNLNPGFPSDLLYPLHKMFIVNRGRGHPTVIHCLVSSSSALFGNSVCFQYVIMTADFLKRSGGAPQGAFSHHMPCKHLSSSSVICCYRFPIFSIMFFFPKVKSDLRAMKG